MPIVRKTLNERIPPKGRERDRSIIMWDHPKVNNFTFEPRTYSHLHTTVEKIRDNWKMLPKEEVERQIHNLKHGPPHPDLNCMVCDAIKVVRGLEKLELKDEEKEIAHVTFTNEDGTKETITLERSSDGKEKQ
jgi:hypothetical protein